MSQHVDPVVTDPQDAGLGQLVGAFTQDVSSLIRDEMALAKVEITTSVKQAGVGAGLFGAAGLIALYGVGALVATVILALALVVDAWLAALIVTLVLFLAAALAAVLGKKKVEQVTPPLDETKQNVQRDVATIKGGTP